MKFLMITFFLPFNLFANSNDDPCRKFFEKDLESRKINIANTHSSFKGKIENNNSFLDVFTNGNFDKPIDLANTILELSDSSTSNGISKKNLFKMDPKYYWSISKDPNVLQTTTDSKKKLVNWLKSTKEYKWTQNLNTEIIEYYSDDKKLTGYRITDITKPNNPIENMVYLDNQNSTDYCEITELRINLKPYDLNIRIDYENCNQLSKIKKYYDKPESGVDLETSPPNYNQFLCEFVGGKQDENYNCICKDKISQIDIYQLSYMWKNNSEIPPRSSNSKSSCLTSSIKHDKASFDYILDFFKDYGNKLNSFIFKKTEFNQIMKYCEQYSKDFYDSPNKNKTVKTRLPSIKPNTINSSTK